MQVSNKEPPPLRSPPRTPDEDSLKKRSKKQSKNRFQILMQSKKQKKKKKWSSAPRNLERGASGNWWNHGIGPHYSNQKSMLKFCALRMKGWKNPAW